MELKQLLDFGLFILIWMTQLVVYPSFTYFTQKDLARWHKRYTVAISIIVIPLMLGQVFIHAYLLSQTFSYIALLAFIGVILAWIVTFFYAVPLHNQIAESTEVHQAAQRLVKVNWYRTVIWTLVFFLGVIELWV